MQRAPFLRQTRLYPVHDPWKRLTPESVPRNTSRQTLQPVYVVLRFFNGNRMSLLQHFMYGDEGFEGLDFVCKYGLPREEGVLSVSVKWH